MRASPHRHHIAVVAALPWLIGCPEDSQPPGPAACLTLNASGGVVTSDDGVLSVALRPDSLSESAQVCVQQASGPPDGPPPAFGRAYRVTPDVDLDVAASITYQDTLPLQPDDTSIAVILREDFERGEGRWIALPVTRLEPENDLIAATDMRLSMFYGLLDGSGDDADTQ